MLLSKEVFFEEYVERIEKMVKGEPMSQETISTSLQPCISCFSPHHHIQSGHMQSFFLIYCGHQSLQQTALFCFCGGKNGCTCKIFEQIQFRSTFLFKHGECCKFLSWVLRQETIDIEWHGVFPFLSTGYFSKINVMASSEVKFEIYISILGG